MKNSRRIPFSWKLEEYVFGAAALRDEIKRHKREDDKPWNPIKAVGIRVLYVYALITALCMIFLGLVLQIFRKRR